MKTRTKFLDSRDNLIRIHSFDVTAHRFGIHVLSQVVDEVARRGTEATKLNMVFLSESNNLYSGLGKLDHDFRSDFG